jgi:hypothetical protein
MYYNSIVLSLLMGSDTQVGKQDGGQQQQYEPNNHRNKAFLVQAFWHSWPYCTTDKQEHNATY